MNIDHQLIEVVGKTFPNLNQKIKRRKSQPHRITFNGDFITTHSCKTVWPSIGAAKSALLNHLNYSYDFRIFMEKFTGNNYPFQFYKEVIADLEKAGVIQFVPVDI